MRRLAFITLTIAAGLLGLSCSTSDAGESASTGGSGATGGSATTGGATSALGGDPTTGGSSAAGGATTSGGAPTDGGSPTKGGAAVSSGGTGSGSPGGSGGSITPAGGSAGNPAGGSEGGWTSGGQSSLGGAESGGRSSGGFAGSAGGGGGAGGAAPQQGLLATYFREFYTPEETHVTRRVDYDWSDVGPLEDFPRVQFSARYEGQLVPEFSEVYTLETSSDDGVRLWVNTELLIDNWTTHDAETDTVEIDLEAGAAYSIRLEYFQLWTGAELQFFWSSASQPREVVPAERTIPAAARTETAPLLPPYDNPVTTDGWPDPGVMQVPGSGTEPTVYYLVATAGSFPIRRSLNLIEWENTGSSLLPGGVAPWAADGGRNWAPELHYIGGKYLAYYTASAPQEGIRDNPLAIGAAIADSPTGPYTHRETPIVPAGDYGTIDATAFVDDDGTPYLYWKTDGNCCGVKTGIWVQELNPDGMSLKETADPVLLIENEDPWEAHVIEGPWVIHRGDYYYMFYSADSYMDPYKTGVARATSPVGPFEKLGSPILIGDDAVQGPGHGTVLNVHGQDVFVHHGWVDGNGRYLFVSPITWADGWPSIGDGTTPESVPHWP